MAEWERAAPKAAGVRSGRVPVDRQGFEILADIAGEVQVEGLGPEIQDVVVDELRRLGGRG
ncbi:MAG: hypothetical protein ACQER6_08875 [Pseudomonadota bacterium]